MRKIMLLLSVFVVLNSPDCDPQKQSERINALEADVKQLKADVAGLKQNPKTEHHYELRSEGLRTWRFDSATGDTCIQLTSEADWKRKGTMSQSCGCSDDSEQWIAMPKDTDQQRQAADNYYSWIVKPACGN
jgi:hypothetical protein